MYSMRRFVPTVDPNHPNHLHMQTLFKSALTSANADNPLRGLLDIDTGEEDKSVPPTVRVVLCCEEGMHELRRVGKNVVWHGVWRTGRTRRACGRRRGGAPDRCGTRGEGLEEVGVLDKLLKKAERGAANVFVWMLLCGLQSRQDGCVQVTEWTKEIIPDCISERVVRVSGCYDSS